VRLTETLEELRVIFTVRVDLRYATAAATLRYPANHSLTWWSNETSAYKAMTADVDGESR
jgi:hypothetical protein